jgi:predicted dithiol-disulfide oxidoreductase (DUF899 family)
MSKPLHSVRFPGESVQYRDARNELLRAEIALRKKIEQVAAMRRALPLGGEPQDYAFEEGSEELTDAQTVRSVRLAELFHPERDSLTPEGRGTDWHPRLEYPGTNLVRTRG